MIAVIHQEERAILILQEAQVHTLGIRIHVHAHIVDVPTDVHLHLITTENEVIIILLVHLLQDTAQDHLDMKEDRIVQYLLAICLMKLAGINSKIL